MSHTPGPWVVNGSAIEAELPDGTECLAHVYDGDEAPPSGSPDANARLIAAAPDLLAALQGLVEVEDPEWPLYVRHEFAAARKAVARASGEAPTEKGGRP